MLIFTLSDFAQEAGNTGLSFLKIGSNATSIGTADIGLLNSNISSVFYNPASVNFQLNSGISFTHQMWIQDLTSEVLNANFSMFGLPVTVGVNSTKVSGFEVRTNPSPNPDATFNVNYFYGSISSGFNIYDNIDFGFTIKYLYESLLSDDASGTGYDLGLIYSNMIENLKLGASLRNLGSMNKLRNEQTKLPTDFIVNATYKVELPETFLSILPIFGVQKYIDGNDIHMHFGTEATYDKQFSLRLGYITGYESKGFTAGAGVLWNSFNFDYAFTPFSFGIGSANTFTLGYIF